LKGLEEGSADFNRLQSHMWQFVYGRTGLPVWYDEPVGPLESVIIVDPDYRIVAASDPMQVEKRFLDPEHLKIFEAALFKPQVSQIADARSDGRPVAEVTLSIPNDKGESMGFIRLRYVGGEIAAMPSLPSLPVTAEPHFSGPLLAGVIALLGVGFGILATSHVVALTRRIGAMAQGVRLPPARVPGGEALSVIEEKLESLSHAVRRDDLFVSSLSEALKEGVILLDPNGRMVTVNRQAAEALKLGGEEISYRAARFQALLDSSPELASVIRNGLEKRLAVRERPVTLSLPGEHSATLQITTYVLEENGRSAGMMLMIKDRESIDLLEKTLQEASRLQSIALLTGSVAHEVKNPLGAIGIHLEHLRRHLARAEKRNPRAEERVGVLREEVGRLREILEEWLGFTAPEERAATPANVTDILTSVDRLLQVEARHQDVEIAVEAVGDLGEVDISTHRLRQVVLNLALNGLQAMQDGGKLILRGSKVGSRVMLEIEDTGGGIPPELSSRVFDFHFSTRSGGSGLGLAICRQLIEDAGGIITFISRPGVGTVFQVMLPERTVRSGRLLNRRPHQAAPNQTPQHAHGLHFTHRGDVDHVPHAPGSVEP